MPNHITNKLEIELSHSDYDKAKEQLSKFKEIAIKDNKESEDNETLSMYNFIPRPKEQDSNWYDWNCENWGTKWDTYECSIDDESEDYIYYTFLTAWCPPLEFLKTIGKRFPLLEFYIVFQEEGMGFMGKMFIKEGKVVVEKWLD